MTTPTLPIASRTLASAPLKDAEINLMLNWLAANASNTSANFVTGIGTIAPQFLTGLASYLENRRSLSHEIAVECQAPHAILTDAYGNPSVIPNDNL